MLNDSATSARERARMFRPGISSVEPNQEIRWLGWLWYLGNSIVRLKRIREVICKAGSSVGWNKS